MKTFRKTHALLFIVLLFLLGALSNLVFPNTSPVETKEDSSVAKISPSQQPAPTEVIGVQGEQTVSDSNLYPVVKVIDGDTITVDINGKNETLRLIGINTPETVDPRRPVECFGIQASNAAKQVLSGKRVRLESDSTQTDRDKYDRLLRYVFLENGTNYNKWMIQEGYAYEYTYDLPYKYQSEFKTAQSQAQVQERGLWSPSACSGQTKNQSSGEQSANPGQSANTISGDKDCKDFLSQNEAQQFFISQGGPNSDPHKLDSDKDGVVCESLP